LQRPSSSLKSRRMRPSGKASTALSGKIFSAVLRRLIHHEMYDLNFLQSSIRTCATLQMTWAIVRCLES
jgi:hypothetical protein